MAPDGRLAGDFCRYRQVRPVIGPWGELPSCSPHGASSGLVIPLAPGW